MATLGSFLERIKSKFVPRNSDYILSCKFRDLVNATNDNLWQYVRAYSDSCSRSDTCMNWIVCANL
jgi:hypothetical protein